MGWHLARAFFLHRPMMEGKGQESKEMNLPCYKGTNPPRKGGTLLLKFSPLNSITLAVHFKINFGEDIQIISRSFLKLSPFLI